MIRALLAVIFLALATAGCGGGGECTEGCQKMARCEPGKMTNLDQCVAECAEDPGNRSIAKCLLSVSGCEAPAGSCPVVDSTCTLAAKKITECQTASGTSAPPLKFTGWCSDHAELATTTGTKTVTFRTWSTTYLGCTVDPKTCRCPGQPWFTEL